MASYRNLGEFRERMFGFSQAFVAREARIDIERLGLVEGDEAPSVAEVERLADLYALDADTLAELPVEVPADDAVTALALLDEFRDVSPIAKRRILAAANAARDVVELRTLLQQRRGYDTLHARHRPASA